MTTQLWVLLLSGVLNYRFGSLMFALYICKNVWIGTKLHFQNIGVDLMTEGSCNPGSTNANRLCGAKAFALSFLLDWGKGAMAIALSRFVVLPLAGIQVTTTMLFAFMICAVVGHMFPDLTGFKGGKAIAIGNGCLFAIDWRLGLATMAAWILITVIADRISVASMVLAAVLPLVVQSYIMHASVQDMNWPFALMLMMSAMSVTAHSANIQRLDAGEEKGLGVRRKVLAPVLGVLHFIVRWTFVLFCFVIVNMLIRLFGEVEGKANIPRGGGYIVASNHLFWLDSFYISAPMWRVLVYLAKIEIWEFPLGLGAFAMWVFAGIPVVRDHPSRNDLQVLEDRVTEELSDDEVVASFPEEHRNRTPWLGLLPLYKGTSKLAAAAASRGILPVGITYPFSGWRKWFPRIRYGELIENPERLPETERSAFLEAHGVKRSRDWLHMRMVEELENLTGMKVMAA